MLGVRWSPALMLSCSPCYAFHYFSSFPWFIERRNVDPGRINVIEMLVRPTLGIMSIGHNISGARLLAPLEEGAIVTKVTKVTMGTE